MATTTARRTTRKNPDRKTSVIPQQIDHAEANRMASIYSGSEPESPWQGFQNAGPDCYWEVPGPAHAN